MAEELEVVEIGSKPLADDKHEIFCFEYLKDLNVKQAAIRAGYTERSSGQSGHVTFHRVDVQARINFLKKERMLELGLDVFYVLKNLRSIVDRGMQTEEVLDNEGNPVLVEGPDGQEKPEYRYDAQTALKANELIMKYLGMNKERIDVTTNGENINKPIDEEKFRQIAREVIDEI